LDAHRDRLDDGFGVDEGLPLWIAAQSFAE
jgi:hypothetical protein